MENPRREYSYVDENWLIWSIVLVVFIYGLAGGLEGAVWSDTVQGTLIFVREDAFVFSLGIATAFLVVGFLYLALNFGA